MSYEHRYPTLPNLEQQALCRELIQVRQKRDKARSKLAKQRLEQKVKSLLDRLIKANMGMIGVIAKSFKTQARHLVHEDLMQIGILGFMHALEKYDPEYGNTLWTYAAYWVRATLRRELDEQEHTVRVPPHFFETKRQMSRMDARIGSDENRSPTIEEYCRELELTVPQVKRLMETSTTRALSLDYQSEDGFAMVDNLEDSTLEDLEVKSTRLQHMGLAVGLLRVLNERERAIIKARIWDDRSLVDVGLDYNITRERIRQIEAKALKKLRKAMIRRASGDFLDG